MTSLPSIQFVINLKIFFMFLRSFLWVVNTNVKAGQVVILKIQINLLVFYYLDVKKC